MIEMIQKTVIAGGGRVGFQTAEPLDARDENVTIVERDEGRIEDHLPGLRKRLSGVCLRISIDESTTSLTRFASMGRWNATSVTSGGAAAVRTSTR